MNRLMLITLIITLSGTIRADDTKKDAPPKIEKFTSAEKAGRDFAIQGEYRGQSTKLGKLGVQVIAQGDGKFEVQLLAGGLPGDGWSSGTRYRVPRNGLMSFNDQVISNGKLSLPITGETLSLDQVVRESPALGMKPPSGAMVLFDGKSAEQWEKGQLVEGNLLKWGTTSKAKFGDCTMHVEFRLPFMPRARGQERANSGVYLQGRYEVQVLDSFGLEGKDNECGGIYQVSAPKVNMCYPPLSWQTYDIDFTAPRFDGSGKKVNDAVISVRHNGVLIQDKVKIPAPTGGSLTKETAEPGPIYLQDHGDPVVFRNIWVQEKKSP
jgi:Domain of Unknown Function (DUF1080)